MKTEGGGSPLGTCSEHRAATGARGGVSRLEPAGRASHTSLQAAPRRGGQITPLLFASPRELCVSGGSGGFRQLAWKPRGQGLVLGFIALVPSSSGHGEGKAEWSWRGAQAVKSGTVAQLSKGGGALGGGWERAGGEGAAGRA